MYEFTDKQTVWEFIEHLYKYLPKWTQGLPLQLQY
jgi:hypothetical protein